jgi:hypothetical protein
MQTYLRLSIRFSKPRFQAKLEFIMFSTQWVQVLRQCQWRVCSMQYAGCRLQVQHTRIGKCPRALFPILARQQLHLPQHARAEPNSPERSRGKCRSISAVTVTVTVTVQIPLQLKLTGHGSSPDIFNRFEL